MSDLEVAGESRQATGDRRQETTSTRSAQRRLSLVSCLFAPGVLALLLVLVLLVGRDLLGVAARPLQGLLALALVGSLTLAAGLHSRLRALPRSALWHGLAVATVVVLALGLRVWGHRFGLPYFEHPDEWAVADKALEMARTGNFNPERFIYPNLYIYLQLGVVILHFLWGVNAGIYQTLNDIEPAAFYAWARLLTAVLGAGAVLATYAATRLLYDRSIGLLAAALLAVFPAHVADSHFITTDTPASFFTMLAFVGIAALATRPPARRWDRLALALIAGLAVGLAMGTKYNVALLVLPLLLAVFWAERTENFWLAVGSSALFALFGVGLGFTLSTPFWPAALPQFLNEVASIVEHYKFKGHPGHESSPAWLFYVELTLRAAPLATLFAAVGIGLAFLRHRRSDLLLLVFFVPSFLQLAGLKVTFYRNLMPLLPFVCMFAALGAALAASALTQAVRGRLAWRSGTLLALLGTAMLVGPLLAALQETRVLARPTTRMLATAWIEQHAPPGSRIWLEDQTLILPAERFRVAGGRPLLEQSLEWYQAHGYRYLVASISGYSTAERARLEQLATQAAGTERFDGMGERHGPALLVIDSGLPTPADEPRTRINAPLAGGALLLEGYRHPTTIAAGAVLPLALFWRADAPLDHDYTVFVHLLDADGNKLAQRDVAPLEGSRPTSQWQVGELLRDDQDLAIPATVPPGSYQLSVGMYRSDTLEQLNATPILLAPVAVSAPR